MKFRTLAYLVPKNSTIRNANGLDGQNKVILWPIAAIISSIANGKFLLWQNDLYFACRVCFDFFLEILGSTT